MCCVRQGSRFRREVACVSIGPVTSAALRDAGLVVAAEAETASLDGLVDACVRLFARLVAGPGFVAGVALFLDGAIHAAGFARDADGAAVQDELVAEGDPVIFGDDLH